MAGEKVSIAPAAVRLSFRKALPTATIKLPHAVPAEVKAEWRDDDEKVRVQHFPGGLLVVGHRDALRASPRHALAVNDYKLGPHPGDVLTLPSTVGTDEDDQYAEQLNPASVLFGFDERGLIVPTATMDEVIADVAPTWALGRVAQALVAEQGGRNPIDITEAVAAIGASITPSVVYRAFPDARPV